MRMVIFCALVVFLAAVNAQGRGNRKQLRTMGYYFRKFENLYATCEQTPGLLAQVKEEIRKCSTFEEEDDEPEEICLDLGLQSGHLSDLFLSASSFLEEAHPKQGRLNWAKKDDKRGAWCAATNNELQWFQIDLGVPMQVTGLKIQGENIGDNWVKTFSLEFSIDGSSWSCLFGADGRVKIFDGNHDCDSVQQVFFTAPLYTRVLRIVPRSWKGHICIRAEVCVEELVELEADTRSLDEPSPEWVVGEPLDLLDKSNLMINSKTIESSTGLHPQAIQVAEAYPIKAINFQRQGGPTLYRVQDPEAVPLDTIDRENLFLDSNPEEGSTNMIPEAVRVLEGQPIKAINFQSPDGPNLYTAHDGPVQLHPLQPIKIEGQGHYVEINHITSPQPVDRIPKLVPSYVEAWVAEFEYTWSPMEFSGGMCIQFDLGQWNDVVGIFTTGSPNVDNSEAPDGKWLTSYYVHYFNIDTGEWDFVRGKNERTILELTGNQDGESSQENVFSPGIHTDKLKICVAEYHGAVFANFKLRFHHQQMTPQIISGPAVKSDLLQWYWDNANGEQDNFVEVKFAKGVKVFEFQVKGDSEDLVAEYYIQRYNNENQWEFFLGDDGNRKVFTPTDGLVIGGGGEVFYGLRITAHKWQSGKRIFMLFNMKVAGGSSIRAEFGVSSRALMRTLWKVDPVPERDILEINFFSTRRILRIESVGQDDAWVSQFELMCMQAGQWSYVDSPKGSKIWEGNFDALTMEEHVLENIVECEKIKFVPLSYEKFISMLITVYFEGVLQYKPKVREEVFTYEAETTGSWESPLQYKNQYAEMMYDGAVSPDMIKTKCMAEDKCVRKYELLYREDDKDEWKTIENERGEIRIFDDRFVDDDGWTEHHFPQGASIRGLRILALETTETFGLLWSYKFHTDDLANVNAVVRTERLWDPVITIPGMYHSTYENVGQFLEMDFKLPIDCVSLDTANYDNDNWITELHIEYFDAGEWKKLTNEDGSTKMFVGYDETDGEQHYELKLNFQFIRLVFDGCHGTCSIKYKLFVSGQLDEKPKIKTSLDK